MKRLNFTLDGETVDLLERLSQTWFSGNKSQTVRAALESLATHVGHDGWVISGYTPVRVPEEMSCHSCGQEQSKGALVYRPVFERGNSAKAIPRLPEEEWLECPACIQTAS